MTETIEQYLWHRLCREVKAACAPSEFLLLPSGHVQLLLPDESICEILLIFYDFCGQESFMLPFFPDPSTAPPIFLCRLEYFPCLPSLFLLIFYGPRDRVFGGVGGVDAKGFGFMAEMATLATK